MDLFTRNITRSDIYKISRRKQRRDYRSVLKGETEESPTRYWAFYENSQFGDCYERHFREFLTNLRVKTFQELLEKYNRPVRVLDLMAPPGTIVRSFAENKKIYLEQGICVTATDHRDVEQIEQDIVNNINVITGDLGETQTWNHIGKNFDLISCRPYGGLNSSIGSLYLFLKLLYKGYERLAKDGKFFLEFEYMETQIDILIPLLDFFDEHIDIEYSGLSLMITKHQDSLETLPFPSEELAKELIKSILIVYPQIKVQILLNKFKNIFITAPGVSAIEQ